MPVPVPMPRRRPSGSEVPPESRSPHRRGRPSPQRLDSRGAGPDLPYLGQFGAAVTLVLQLER